MSAVDSNLAALQQCGDILRLQEEACNILKDKLEAARQRVSREDFQSLEQKLESEKADHHRTKSELERERDRARFAESELAILRRQLSREKMTFENAFGLLKSQALSDSSKAEDLLAKCSALEALCAQKDEELGSKEQVIVKLRGELRLVEERHHQELLEVQVQAQQNAYVSSHLALQEARKRRGKQRQTKGL